MPLRTDLKPPHFRMQARNPLDTSSEVTYKKRNYGNDEGEGYSNPETGPDPARGRGTDPDPALALGLPLRPCPRSNSNPYPSSKPSPDP